MKLLSVDDDPLARRRLATMLAAADVEVVGEAGTGREAVERADALDVDAVLMDIAMPVMDGLEAARHLARGERRPAVIFCTAYDEHALAAFEAAACALECLQQAFLPHRLDQVVHRRGRGLLPAQAEAVDAAGGQRQRSHLAARMRGSLRLIPIEDVHYQLAEEKYVLVHHARGEDLIEESLKSLEAEFGERFQRIHRNCLVATDEFQELRRLPDGQVQAILRHGKAPLEVSRRCVPALREKLRHL